MSSEAASEVGGAPPSRRGLVLILSSPSGAGKTTISRKLLQTEPGLALSISVTTRARRASEVDGVDYVFVPARRFEAMREGGELLEWAQVHGHLYGTPREPVEAALAGGRDMLFDIDWQGTLQVKECLPEDAVTVFVLPPSVEDLRVRLERRAEDSPETIAARLDNARTEIAYWRDYDYVIVNRDLDASVASARAILTAERHRRTRATDVAKLVDDLAKGL